MLMSSLAAVDGAARVPLYSILVGHRGRRQVRSQRHGRLGSPTLEHHLRLSWSNSLHLTVVPKIHTSILLHWGLVEDCLAVSLPPGPPGSRERASAPLLWTHAYPAAPLGVWCALGV